MVQVLPLGVIGSCTSSGRAWGLWAARHSQEEADPLGAQPLPRLLERAASKAADSTAFDHPGTLNPDDVARSELLLEGEAPLSLLDYARCLPTCLPTYLSICLASYLATYLPPSFLPTYLLSSTYHLPNPLILPPHQPTSNLPARLREASDARRLVLTLALALTLALSLALALTPTLTLTPTPTLTLALTLTLTLTLTPTRHVRSRLVLEPVLLLPRWDLPRHAGPDPLQAVQAGLLLPRRCECGAAVHAGPWPTASATCCPASNGPAASCAAGWLLASAACYAAACSPASNGPASRAAASQPASIGATFALGASLSASSAAAAAGARAAGRLLAFAACFAAACWPAANEPAASCPAACCPVVGA